MPRAVSQFNGKVLNSLIRQQVRVRRVNETVAKCVALLHRNMRRQGSSTDSRCAGTGIAPSTGQNHPDPETPLLPRPLPKAALLALLLALPSPVQAGESPDSWDLCALATGRAEQAGDLPPHLLTAIARTESGRWHAGRSETLAWPWTVMAEGEGRFLQIGRAQV